MFDRTALTIATSAVMTSPKQSTLSDPGLAEPIAGVVALIRAAPAEQVSILLGIVAAFVQPAATLDLDALDGLPEDMKPPILRFFDHCLRVGLTADDLGSIADVVRACEAGTHQVH